MDTVKFTCHGNSAPAYSCNKPGDQSGEYVRVESIPSWKNNAETPKEYCGIVAYPHLSPRYLVCVEGFDEPRKATYWHGRWIIDGCLGDFIVTHWMPLPEPPKE